MVPNLTGTFSTQSMLVANPGKARIITTTEHYATHIANTRFHHSASSGLSDASVIPFTDV